MQAAKTSTFLTIAGLALGMIASAADASAFWSIIAAWRSASGNTTAPPATGAYSFSGFTPVAGSCVSFGAGSSASAASNAGLVWGGATVTAVGAGAAAGAEQPFVTPIVPTSASSSANLNASWSFAGGILQLDGTGSRTGDGFMELAVLDLTGMPANFGEMLQLTYSSVERALANGFIAPSRVLGVWREDVLTGTFSMSVPLGSASENNVGVLGMAHAVSVPAPGATACCAGSLVLWAGRRRNR